MDDETDQERPSQRQLTWVRPFIEEPMKKNDSETESVSTTPWTALFLGGLAILGCVASSMEHLRHHSTASLVGTAVWAVVLLLLIFGRPRTFSLGLCLLYVTTGACQAAIIAQPSFRQDLEAAWTVVGLLFSLVSFVVVLNMPLRHPLRSRTGISPPFSQPTADVRSPEDNLTMWQWMTVSWMSPLIAIGSKRQLNDEDVWRLGYEFQHTHLHEAFRSLTGSVVVRLVKANWIDLVLLTLLGIVELAANYSVPIILQKLLQAIEQVQLNKKPAIMWALLTLAAELTAAQGGVFSLWFGRRAYERSRGEMITMLHEKVLNRKILGGRANDESEKSTDSHLADVRPEEHDSDRDSGVGDGDEETDRLTGQKRPKPVGSLSRGRTFLGKLTMCCLPSRQKKQQKIPAAPEVASTGKILNLMRNDVYEVAQRFWEFQTLIGAPVGLILSLSLVWHMLGWPSLVGIAVVVCAQLINALLARLLLKWETVRRGATDHKLQQITQYIEAIRHLRWYGWHVRKIDSVLTARQKELNLKVVTMLCSNAIIFVNLFASATLPVAAFWAYTVLAGRELSVDIAFPALQLFDLLQANLRDIPNLITVLLNAAVAVRRIEDFMNEPDLAAEGPASEFSDRLELQNASVAWPGVRASVLVDLTLVFPRGLTVVVGSVASGKTALLQALLGELDLRQGRLIRPDSPVGYCSQTPWLESMTIRDNILFCSAYDAARYKSVLEACALLPDLASFPQGDLSPIGENGIGLSGGQKARVALARAVYSHSTILLLDDPLSALDQQTAEWIVNKCLSGTLVRDRTVVLVTHRIDLCHGISEQVVEMSGGRARVYKDTTAVASGSLTAVTSNEQATQARDDAHVQEAAAIKEKFEDEEHRAHGGVRFKIYWEYIKAGKLKWWSLVLIFALIWRMLEYALSWFLKEWGEAYETFDIRQLLVVQKIPLRPAAASPIGRFLDGLPNPGVNPKPWLIAFMILVIVQAVAVLMAQLIMVVVTYTSGKGMFLRIMNHISNASFRFYDVTPVGRLMNRLTGDVNTVDGPIARLFLVSAWEFVAWTSSLVVIASVTPLFLVLSLGLSSGLVYIFLRFLPTSQSLRRLEMVSLSPLMSNFGALLGGLMTVRAFHAQIQFQNRVIRVTDAFQKMDHFYWSLQSWLTYRFLILSAVSTLVLTLLAIYSGLSAGLTAFVLIAAQRFVQSTYRLCKGYGQLQLDFVSVERVVELLHIDQEDPGTVAPPAHWPALASAQPAVEFENVTIRYAPHLEPALKDISFSIPSGSSTAVIGRTGSGKSTLALALLATITPESGRILVDGIDISRVSKQDLRTRVTFLAQDPILFQGTLRTNIDPMDDYSDSECISVLLRIHGDTKYRWTLGTVVEAGGRNLSQGQRQLVGLARAMLRRSAIVIMDEATASVDLDTSWEIQRVVKEELAGSTVITIAHRAGVVRDCDMVVKLDAGSVVATGTPAEVDEISSVGAGQTGGRGSGRDEMEFEIW